MVYILSHRRYYPPCSLIEPLRAPHYCVTHMGDSAFGVGSSLVLLRSIPRPHTRKTRHSLFPAWFASFSSGFPLLGVRFVGTPGSYWRFGILLRGGCVVVLHLGTLLSSCSGRKWHQFRLFLLLSSARVPSILSSLRDVPVRIGLECWSRLSPSLTPSRYATKLVFCLPPYPHPFFFSLFATLLIS